MSPKGDIRGLPGGRLLAPPAMRGLTTILFFKSTEADNPLSRPFVEVAIKYLRINYDNLK